MTGNFEQSKTILELTFPSDNTKSAFATEQFYILLHLLSRKLSLWQIIFGRKNEYSLEIVSDKKNGIRYLLVAGNKFIENIRRNLLSYLPGIRIKQINDYLDDFGTGQEIVELKLANHFALTLGDQKKLLENDPISYLTGNMTKLDDNELISCQFIVSPVVKLIHINIFREIKRIKKLISENQPLKTVLEKNIFQKIAMVPVIGWLFIPLVVVLRIINFIVMFLLSMIIGFFDTSGESVPFLRRQNSITIDEKINPYETELRTIVKDKFNQPLFETSIRVLAISKDSKTRINGLITALGQLNSPYQSFKLKHLWLKPNGKFKLRKLSLNTPFNPNPILSVSELSDLYHFPCEITTKTEDMVKIHSKEMPAPLSMKNNENLDVVFGKNTYGNSEVKIGLTDDDRSRHVYILGQTGSGKSTIMFHMAKDDINKGRGMAILDPHGDLAEDILNTVPNNRIDDCIYFNPFDVAYPIGLNLLELTAGLEGDQLEQEKELVGESVISVFRRVFNKEDNTDSHRIEYILRNAIYTAFTLPNSTIFTVYELLNNPKFQKKVTRNLEDENLKKFWKNEFGRAGSYQVVKMVSGVTAKIGRFLFSPTAKRILEQPKSTINFDEILDKQKILICNLAEGKLGEDTSQLLGTTIITKIQQAAMRRVRTNKSNRIPFYLFIDEFQNFATSSFIKLLSGGRKFGLRLTIAEQSTSQQEDRNIVNVILANTGTVVCFRTASPIDEQLMLSQFTPYVDQGDIVNLPRYRFFMKLAAVNPEEPMSGETIPIVYTKDKKRLKNIVKASQKNYAIKYQKVSLVEELKKKKYKQNSQLLEGLSSLT